MSSKFSSAFVVAALLSHTVLAPLTAVAQEQDASAQQVQKTTDSNKSVSIDSPEASKNVSQDSTTQGNSQTQTENLEGAGSTRGGEMSDKSKSDSATAATTRGSIESIDTWMPDKALQAAVAQTLSLDVSQLTKDKMSSLTALDAGNAGIGSLEGIQYASNLAELYLSHNQISDLTPLQQLSNLEWINLDSNHISDVTPLQHLSNLEWLVLYDNQISDLTPLQNLNLTNFTASNQTITLPTIYVLNKQPYSASVQTAIKGLAQSTLTISPQAPSPWIGNYSEVGGSGKTEWSSTSPIPQTGDLVTSWTDQNNDFSGQYIQPYALSQASITVQDKTIYVGDHWQASDNFVSGLNHDGHRLDFSKITVTGTVNTSQPGVYPIVYSYEGLEEKVEVTVLQNQTSVEGHDSTLYTGDSWNAQDNFDGAKDKAGNPVNFQDVQVTGTVDTTQPGKYKVTYSYGGVQKEVEVTVLQKASKENNNTSNSGENKKNENQKPLSTNEKDKALPSTGEKGSVWLFVSGIVFIFASVLALLRFKKKINRKNIEE